MALVHNAMSLGYFPYCEADLWGGPMALTSVTGRTASSLKSVAVM